MSFETGMDMLEGVISFYLAQANKMEKTLFPAPIATTIIKLQHTTPTAGSS